MVGRLIALGTVMVALAGFAPGSAAAAGAACPPGVPTQTFTVIDQAGVRSRALVAAQRAVTAQSLQVRAAWGTPCARFAAGGWPLYLKHGGGEPRGEHYFYGRPFGLIWTSGATVEGWSRDFSHEVVEMLEDPTLDVRYVHDGSSWQREIADPVEDLGYRLDGVYVSDFVTPAWYAGASTASDVSCQGLICADASSLIAPAAGAGPWDQMQVLTEPWARYVPDRRLSATGLPR